VPALRELQLAFAHAVFADDLDAFAPAIAPGRFASAQHFQVYRNNVMLSLTEALKAVYPVVLRLVSEGFFAYAADAFIRRHPPRSGNLHDFGSELGAFLSDFPAAAGLAYLPDVARLEWAWHQAFHAADHCALDLARLRRVDPQDYGSLRFRPHPSARLIDSPHPILRIWQANQADSDADQAVSLEEPGVPLLVVRRALEVEIEPLTRADHALLAQFSGGGDLDRASAAALAADPGFDLTRALQIHVDRCTLVDFSLGPDQRHDETN
jgi:hypothetical protein